VPQPLRRIVHETAEGFRALIRYRDVGVLSGLALAQTLTRGFFNVFVVVVALDLLETGAPGVGVLTAAVGAGAVASSGASVFVSGRRLAILEGIGVMLWGLPLTLSGAFPHKPVVLALMCVIGVGNALVDIGLYTLPTRLVPEGLLARLFGAKEGLTALSVAVGSLVTPLASTCSGSVARWSRSGSSPPRSPRSPGGACTQSTPRSRIGTTRSRYSTGSRSSGRFRCRRSTNSPFTSSTST
jgi:hypothetical protein